MGAAPSRAEPMNFRALGVFALVAIGLVGCGGAASSEKTRAASDVVGIASIHARKCGTCHVAPEPKSRVPEQLHSALARHKNRVHLTAAEWAAMMNYLAASNGPTAPQPL